jgi:hypothetical protein
VRELTLGEAWWNWQWVVNCFFHAIIPKAVMLLDGDNQKAKKKNILSIEQQQLVAPPQPKTM